MICVIRATFNFLLISAQKLHKLWRSFPRVQIHCFAWVKTAILYSVNTQKSLIYNIHEYLCFLLSQRRHISRTVQTFIVCACPLKEFIINTLYQSSFSWLILILINTLYGFVSTETLIVR